MHLRRGVNVIEVNAKHILQSRQSLAEDIFKRKTALQKAINFCSNTSANLDLACAKYATLQNELDVYQKLEVYRNNQQSLHLINIG